MPIDISHVEWIFVGLMAVGAFVASLIGHFIAFKNRFIGAIIAGIVFGIFFILWNYYPHPGIPIFPTVNSYTYPTG